MNEYLVPSTVWSPIGRNSKSMAKYLELEITHAYDSGSCGVFVVRDANNNFLLKLPKVCPLDGTVSFSLEQISAEARVLPILEGIQGISKGIASYRAKKGFVYGAANFLFPFLAPVRDYVGVLKEYIHGRPLTVEQALEYSGEVERILREAHSVGVAGFDVQEANIILSEEKRPYLIDMGTCITKRDDMDQFRHQKNRDLSLLEDLVLMGEELARLSA